MMRPYTSPVTTHVHCYKMASQTGQRGGKECICAQAQVQKVSIARIQNTAVSRIYLQQNLKVVKGLYLIGGMIAPAKVQPYNQVYDC